MKIRTGFVSNSSSSSFCILGIKIQTEKEFDELYQKNKDIFNSHGLVQEYACNSYDETITIGLYPERLDENKTIKEHKENLAKALSEFTEKEITYKDIGFITDGGYNG